MMALDESDFIDVRFKYDHVYGDPVALAMNKGLLETIHTAVEPKVAWNAIDEWLAGRGKVTFVGKNIEKFDLAFIEYHHKPLNRHHCSVDIGSLFLRKDDEVVPNLELCCARAGIELVGLHDAYYDALTVVKLFKKFRGK
jgi:DNA polymerase III epsilon subunit-like protein